VGTRGLASIPEAVRVLAVEPLASARERPAGTSHERILNDRFCLVLTPVRSLVERVRVAEADVAATVDEVRQLLRQRERTQAAWFIAPTSRPTDLPAILAGLGFQPYDEPPLEPQYAAMALVQPPLGTPAPGVSVRAVESLEELATATEIAGEAAGMSAQDRMTMRGDTAGRFEMHKRGDGRTYLAFVDGEPVGMGRGGFQEAGMSLSGGAVLPHARGRGAYRALIDARWRDAVCRGTPALTVQAGAMSRPILERLGFVTVATLQVLCDRFE
jgi:GNAT superfamily N-acetyltransferase